jgi:mono/diheme cytochrome c family protein
VLDLFANPSAARPYRAPLATLFAAALLATSAGCAGGLDDPDRFTGGTPSSCAAGTTAPSIFQAQCFGCHATDTKANGAGLDLQASGLPGRLYTTNAACNSSPLADRNAPAQSFFLKKLTSSPGCGSQMPLGNALSAADQKCIEEWLVAGKPSSP